MASRFGKLALVSLILVWSSGFVHAQSSPNHNEDIPNPGAQAAQNEPAYERHVDKSRDKSGRKKQTPPSMPGTPLQEGPCQLQKFIAMCDQDLGNKSGYDYDDCSLKEEFAEKSCNTLSTIGMSPQAGAMVEAAIGQAAQIFSQMKGQSKNVAEQCKSQADLSKIIAGISAAKGAACGTTMGLCKSTCKTSASADNCKATTAISNFQLCVQTERAKARQPGLPNDFEARVSPWRNYFAQASKLASRAVDTCEGFSTNVQMAVMQGLSMGQNALQNSQCAKLASTDPAATIPPWSPTNPTDGSIPIAANDCSDPAYAASSLVCICQSNPANALCGGATNNPTGTGPVGSAGPGTPSRPYSPGLETGTTGAPIDQSQVLAKTASGSNTTPDGGGGGLGNPFGGSGGGSGAGAGEGGPAGSDIDKNVIQGMSGGGSGGLGGGGGGYGEGGAYARGSGSAGGEDKGWFNLKKFLPNKKDYKNRGLAGMSIPATDGITGPMGPSIWEKVTNQYQIQKTNLINDR